MSQIYKVATGGSGGSGVITLSDNAGTLVSPGGTGNIQLEGIAGLVFTAGANKLTLTDTSFTKLIGNGGTFATADASRQGNIVGSGAVAVTGDNIDTLTVSVSGGGLVWEFVTTATKQMEPNHGYIIQYTAGTKQCELTLPITADLKLGDIIRVVGCSQGGIYKSWKIKQQVDQRIHISNLADGTTVNTTIGATHGLESSKTQDTVELVVISATPPASTQLEVISYIGNILTF